MLIFTAFFPQKTLNKAIKSKTKNCTNFSSILLTSALHARVITINCKSPWSFMSNKVLKYVGSLTIVKLIELGHLKDVCFR